MPVTASVWRIVPRPRSSSSSPRLLEADRTVLQFPTQWYSSPSLLKVWQ
ncbi:NAD(P)H-dependent oxidoreductase [Halomonas sp. IOP_14]|nr:NAD(P)H-dependent oxidoreductase [Halomonas sp. IOP_14]